MEINRVDVFFADLVVLETARSFLIDARPRCASHWRCVNAPIYVEDDVMNRAGSPARLDDNAEEIERFDEFVQTLSPDDF